MSEKPPQPNQADLNPSEAMNLEEISNSFQELSQAIHPLGETFGEDNHLYANMEKPESPIGPNVGTQQKTESGFAYTEGTLGGKPFTVAARRLNTPDAPASESIDTKAAAAFDLGEIFSKINQPESATADTASGEVKTSDSETPKTEAELLDEIQKLHEHNDAQRARELTENQNAREGEAFTDSVGEFNKLDAFADQIDFSLDYSLGANSDKAMRSLIELGYGPKSAAVLRELISGEGDYKLDSAAKVKRYAQLERERGASLRKRIEEVYSDKPAEPKKPKLHKRLAKALASRRNESQNDSDEAASSETPVVDRDESEPSEAVTEIMPIVTLKKRPADPNLDRVRLKERKQRIKNRRLKDSRRRGLRSYKRTPSSNAYTGNDEEIRRSLERDDSLS